MTDSWLERLETGDRVMIRFGEGDVKSKKVTNASAFTKFINVGKFAFDKTTGLHKYGYQLIPFDPAIDKDNRKRSKSLKRIHATEWHDLDTETLLKIAALLPEKKS